jgi:myo-inositol-1(or 4)-monophosphatase
MMGSEREFAIELVTRAGNELVSHFREDRELRALRRTVKGITTKYDKEMDEVFVKAISEKYPAFNIWTEESGDIDRGSEYTWIADPLDGTVNFALGNPLFCVTLALLRKEEPILGVTYAPAIDELFVAEKGKGAFLNLERISVSTSERLEDCYVYFCEGGDEDRLRTGKINALVYPRVRDLRKLGSASLEAAWIACGRGDAYITTKIEPWDIAAGVLLVREAGGKVTDFRGEAWRAQRSDLVFSNGRVHERILELVRGL